MENPFVPMPSAWHVLLGLYAFLLPFMLYAVWSTLAFWDLGRRDDLGRGASIGWIAGVLLFPFVGAAAYHVAGGSRVPGHLRAAVVGGGAALYLLVLLAGSLLGGVA
jgi:hypothetical protein